MTLHRIAKMLIAFVLLVSLLLGASPSLFVFAMNYYDFSTFSEYDAMAFVEDHNIEIPTKLLLSGKVGEFTLSTILRSYYDPYIVFCYNYNETQRYAENIRDAVCSYINSNKVAIASSTSLYSLNYNTVMDENGNWVTNGGYYNEKWLYYNCYAYAINRCEQPSFYSTNRQYQPGDMSGAGTFSSCDTIDSLAEIVKSDLEEMGYSNVMLSPTLPTIDSSQELICVRMSYADYHFMRYDIETNAWYHKPGITAILKYNTVPSEDNIWYREYSFYGSESPDAPPYDSEIVFITYNKKQIDINSDATIREYIQPNNDIFLNLNFADSEIYNFKLNSTHSVKFEIYDENFNFVEGGNGTNIDIHISIINPKYYLRVNFESYEYLDYVDISINDCPYNDHYEQYSATQHKAYCECGEYVLEDHFIAMNFCQLCDAPHTHDYSDHYIPKTNSTHISYCICGSTSIQPHVVSAGAFSSGNKYAICLACGGTATTGIILHQAIGKLPCSENGSFILPNGVIVLVDEDIEAYFDGRLEFIYPDDNLETE